MTKKVIRKRMLCWGPGEMAESGGPGQRRKIYQDGVAYYVVGHSLNGWLLERA
jgi:hypothetical protein